MELTDVLALSRDGKVTIGTPTVDGVKVRAELQQQVKGDKIIVFRYKPKVRYRCKIGHRQLYTRLEIDRIVGPGTSEGEVSDSGS